MINSLRRSPRDHFQAHHECVLEWVRSGYQDHRALDGIAPALAAWLGEYPSHADLIQQLAISDSYTATAYHLHSVAEATARVGLDAALVQAEVTSRNTLSISVLALFLADALLEQNKTVECQRILDFATQKITSIDQTSLFHTYLDLHLCSLRGVFAEATLEYDIAENHYRQAMDRGLFLLNDPAQMKEFGSAWTALFYGSGPDLIQDGIAQSVALLEHDILTTCFKAVLGYARTVQEEEVRAAREAIRFILHNGLPPGGNPVHLRRALLSLPFDELQGYLPNLLYLADDFQKQWSSSAWKMLLYATIGIHPDAPAENVWTYLNQAMLLMPRCHDALTMAVVTGDLMTRRLEGPYPSSSSEAYNELLGMIHLFLTLVGEASRLLVDSPEYLPFKVLIDAPISLAIKFIIDCDQWKESKENALISTLLDALRTRDQAVPSPEFKIGSVEQGICVALERLNRLGYAMTQTEETVAIVLQTVGEETLFFCATGKSAEPLILERAGAAYQTAVFQLRDTLRSSLNLPTKNDPVRGLRPQETIAGKSFLFEYGKAAFNALPLKVAELISNSHVIFFVPDFHSNQDDVPFELFHDGTNFLGLSKVMARALSLQELLYEVEPSVLKPHEPLRSLVVAAPHVPGFAELIYSLQEVHDIRTELTTAGLESPELDESELNTETLLYSFEKACIVHIAAHGVTSAGGEALVLQLDERLLARDIERKPQFLRSFVFLNACSLGKSRYLGGGVSRGIAYALNRQHVPAIVANLLPVYDRSSALLSVEFYKEAKNMAVGEALRRARATLDAQGVSPTHWGCTVLVGNPEYILPINKTKPSLAKRKQDTTVRLLDAYTDPKKTEKERTAALRAAIPFVAKSSDKKWSPRLFASMNWVKGANTLDPNQPADPAMLKSLSVLAHEIGHPEGEALSRFYLAIKPSEERNHEERLADLDGAIRSLEPLVSYDEHWSNLLRECLSMRQRLIAPQEPPVIEMKNGIRVNDQTIPEVRIIFDVQRSIDQQEIRHGRRTQLRLMETTLEDVAWNAVVMGQQNRFTSEEAHIEFATLLAEKLCLKNLLSPTALENARRIIAGFLPYLWNSQRIIHLDQDLAIGQAETLALVLRSIAVNWTPPETSPAHSVVSYLPNHFDLLIQAREKAGLSKYARALIAISSDSEAQDELSALGPSLRGIIEGTSDLPPTSMADCAAWIIGMLLEKKLALMRGKDIQREAAQEIHNILVDLSKDQEKWFMPYLMDGFSSLRTAPLSIMDLWH